MEKVKILAGDDCAEVKAELEAIAGYARRGSRPKNETTEEQKMIRDLQSVFCTGQYRSWVFSQTKRY
jgi:ethanolamine utilization microcompartment shell protein EutL